MRGILLGLALGVMAGAASAQTTVCGQELDKWVCRTQPSANVAQGLQAGAALQQQLDAQGQAARANVDQSFRDARRRHAGQAIAAGHCDQARQIATSSGDLDLMDSVARSCGPR